MSESTSRQSAWRGSTGSTKTPKSVRAVNLSPECLANLTSFLKSWRPNEARLRFIATSDVFLGLRPGRRNSGQSQPQMHICKEEDRYLRTMMVQGAHYILGPFGEDSDLPRRGSKLAAWGGKNAKKRAIVAVARKLAILLRRFWVTGEVYEPPGNSQKAMRAVA
jgi:hypothetical protein